MKSYDIYLRRDGTYKIYLKDKTTTGTLYVTNFPYYATLSAYNRLAITSDLAQIHKRTYFDQSLDAAVSASVRDIIGTVYMQAENVFALDSRIEEIVIHGYTTGRTEIELSVSPLNIVYQKTISGESSLGIIQEIDEVNLSYSVGEAESALSLLAEVSDNLKTTWCEIESSIVIGAVVHESSEKFTTVESSAIGIAVPNLDLWYQIQIEGDTSLTIDESVQTVCLTYLLDGLSDKMILSTDMGDPELEKFCSGSHTIEVDADTDLTALSFIDAEDTLVVKAVCTEAIKRYRLLSELDDLTLEELDDMTLEELDYVIIE